MKRVLLLALCLCALAFPKSQFNSKYTVWQDGEYLIWNLDGNGSVDAAEFCLSLRRANSGIGEPSCRELGEWERDSVSAKYGAWLKQNLEPGVKADYLKARSPMMAAKLQSLEDKIVLAVFKRGGEFQAVIFDETSLAPKAAASVPYTENKVALGDLLAQELFDQRAERRLSKAEREKKAAEPDEFYQETPKADFWGGLSISFSQAPIPLTPYSWYKNKMRSRVKRYRATEDSLSLWNFLEDDAAVFSVYAGMTWFGIFGGEIFYKYSSHDMKIDESDTTYDELSDWRFGMHELGLTLHVTRSFKTTSWLDIAPFFYFGFQYSFLVEDISLKKGVEEPSSAYSTRISFDEVYKGGVIGAGARFVFKEHYALVTRAGISTRGHTESTTPDPNAAASPTTIGEFTVDCFISLGLEYHWTLKR